MKKLLMTGGLLAAVFSHMAVAGEPTTYVVAQAASSPKTPPAAGGPASITNEPSETGNQLSLTPPPPYRGPLAPYGKTINDYGLFPILIFGATYVGNPGMGYIEHSHQTGTFLVYGFDYNVPTSLGWSGTSFHFTGSSTRGTDTSFFGEAGDLIVSNAASNLPRQDHLTRATVMQTLDGDRYFAEFGKGYANDYMARPVCNNAYTCMSVIDGTHKLAGINFPNYSNWFVRAGFKPTENLKIQVAQFEFSTASAGFGTSENGWERWESTYHPAYFADMQYADPRAARPTSYELMYFYNKIPQTDSITGSRTNPTPTLHQSGLFGSTVQTIWRPDTGAGTMLQAFASGTTAFNGEQTQNPYTAGQKYAVDVGLTLKSPFRSRPADSYSIQYTNVGITRDEETFLTSKGLGNGRSESALALSTNFRLYDYVFFQPYAQYAWNLQAGNYASLAGLHAFVPAAPVIPSGQTGKSGWAIGAVFVIPFDRLLGLTTRSSGYDGHYP